MKRFWRFFWDEGGWIPIGAFTLIGLSVVLILLYGGESTC